MRRYVKISIGVLAVLIVGLFGFGYRSYGNAAEPVLDDSVLTSVRVLSPISGLESPAGVPIPVEFQAFGPDPLLSVELWADDANVFVQTAPTPDGVTQLPGFFSWLPASPGVHRLQARSTSSNGAVEASEAVWVLVTPEGSAGEILPQSGVPNATVPAPTVSGFGDPPSLEEIALTPVSNPPSPPSPPSGNDPVVPAEAWSPSLGEFLPWVFSSAKAPNAPELIGAVDACNVMLSLHDLSDDEMGFRVYRTDLGGGESTVPLFTLGAGEGIGWLSFQDDADFGSIHTYVAEAFNSGGTSNPSNPVTLNTYDAGCAPAETPPLVMLTPTALTTTLPVTDAYCYVSNTGQIWSRLPAIGFLTVEEDGQIDLAGKVVDLLIQTEMDGGISNPAETYWDCWGWAEGALTWLGSFSPDSEAEGTIDPEIVSLDLTGDAPSELGSPVMEGLFPSGGSVLDLELIPVVGLPATGTIGEFAGIDFGDLLNSWLATATDPQMLAPRLHYSTDTSDCVNRLPGSVKPDYRIPMCHPGDNVSTLDPGDVSDHPHAYLFWDLDDPNNCDHAEGCIDPRTESYLPYTVVDSGYRLYELTLNGTALVKTFGYGEELFIVPPKGPCGTLRIFEVRTFVELDRPITYESHSPNAIVLFDEPCAASVPVEIEVTFTTLTLGDVDDDDIAPGRDGIGDDVEIYGTFNATPTVGTGGGLKLASAKDDIGCLSNESLIEQPGQDPYMWDEWACPLPAQNGEPKASLGGLKLACFPIESGNLKSHTYRCGGPKTESGTGTYVGLRQFGNNTVHVSTTQGSDSILVSVDIWDVDSESDNDPVCVVSTWISKVPGSNWNTMDGGSWAIEYGEQNRSEWVGGAWYMAQGDNGNASCTVWYVVDVIDS